MTDTALSKLRILDMSRILAGPWATQTMADLGAEILKIERVDGGDDTRKWGPPYMKDTAGENGPDAAYFHATNRNKKSIALDITQADGQEFLKSLVAQSDVFIENFKVGNLAKYGLDYNSLKEINPRLVYCSITGFGQTGPYAKRAGYDFLIQAMGGLMSITGQPDGAEGAGPVKVGVALADILTGLYAVIGILAALRHRDETGEGQHLDISLMDVQVATLANQAMNFLATGNIPKRMGNNHPNIVPYQAFATSDGHMILAVGNDNQFAKFCMIIDRSDLSDDPRFSTNRKRVENREMLTPILAEHIEKFSLDWWIDALEKAGVPGGPINTIDRVFQDPQVIHRGMQIALEHATMGTFPGIGSPLNLSQTPVQYRHAGPVLGQHTREIAENLAGKSADEIEALLANGILKSPD